MHKSDVGQISLSLSGFSSNTYAFRHTLFRHFVQCTHDVPEPTLPGHRNHVTSVNRRTTVLSDTSPFLLSNAGCNLLRITSAQTLIRYCPVRSAYPPAPRRGGISALTHYQIAKKRTNRNGERVGKSLANCETLGNEQREAAV